MSCEQEISCWAVRILCLKGAHKVQAFLCDFYDIIIVPGIEHSDMVIPIRPGHFIFIELNGQFPELDDPCKRIDPGNETEDDAGRPDLDITIWCMMHRVEFLADPWAGGFDVHAARADTPHPDAFQERDRVAYRCIDLFSDFFIRVSNSQDHN